VYRWCSRALGRHFPRRPPAGEDHEYWCRLTARAIVYIGDEPSVLNYRRRREVGTLGLVPAIPCSSRLYSRSELMHRFSRARAALRKAAEARAHWIVARGAARR
jgi:hypothetical protein